MSPIARNAARLLFVLFLTSVGPLADVTLAGEVIPSTSIRLQLSGQALDTPRDVALTYTRIRNAARSVCGYADRVFRQEVADWNACVAATIGQTVTQIANPKLMDFYLTKSGASRGHRNEDFRVGLRVP